MLTRATMTLYGLRYWRPLERQARTPQSMQAAVLARLVAQNRDTRFGREHRFASIRTADDFRAQVPVQEYEQLRPYIDEQRCTATPALTAEMPQFYAQTSGSTGTPKLIPITPTALAMHRQEQALFSYLQYRACPAAYSGLALGVMGAAIERRLDTGHVVGSVSGHLYQSLPKVVQARFVVPPIVSTITNYETKYLVILQLALAAADISYLGAPNPSTFLRLIDLLNLHRDELLRTLATGRSEIVDGLSPDVRDSVSSRLQRQPARAKQLAREATLSFANTWPGIRLVTTWTGGSCGVALATLRGNLPASAMVMELGYQSTEFRGTLALQSEAPGGLPALQHHFFEFVSPEDWETGTARCLSLHELAEGGRYYVIVTTAAGLYRYFMNDLVEVTGRFRGTPLLRFMQKGKGVTSVTGEKLYESQAIHAVEQTVRDLGVAIPFFLLVAHDAPAGYILYAEYAEYPSGAIDATLASGVDRQLANLNVEYRTKRESGRLAAIAVRRLRHGAWVEYKAACVRAGQREGQFKPVMLQYQRDLKWDADAWVTS